MKHLMNQHGFLYINTTFSWISDKDVFQIHHGKKQKLCTRLNILCLVTLLETEGCDMGQSYIEASLMLIEHNVKVRL